MRDLIFRFRLPYVGFGIPLGKWFVSLPFVVGQVNIHPTSDDLFSERYGKRPVFRARGVTFSWVKYRRLHS